MENYQKTQQLVEKTGCSYEDAKAALEGCGWDMLDAVISLEKDGKIVREEAEGATAVQEAPEEFIPEVTPEVIPHDEGRREEASKEDKGNGDSGQTRKKASGLWQRIKRALMNNRMVVIRKDGTQLTNLPILIPVVLLIAFFWATLAAAVIAMILGCRFHFEGEDLGKTNINSTMDKATDYAEKVKNDLKDKANGRQNTDN